MLLLRTSRLRHRGPDWSGVHVHKNSVLAHERLAIVDVGTAANQQTVRKERSMAPAARHTN